MSDVLDEVTDTIVSREAVEKRIRDWKDRIDDLYGSIAGWLPSGWSSEVNNASVSMNEEMMRSVGVPPERLPIMLIRHDEGPRVTIEPRALWIIGANGRLDVRAPTGTFFVLDRAQNFEQADWRLVNSRDRARNVPLDQNSLLSLLG